MEVKHNVRAYLYDNLLTPDPNDFAARVESERSLGVAEICAAAVARGGADISASSMEHGVKLFLNEMSYQLMDGYSVNTEYFTAAMQIKGVFNSATETFDASKHSVLVQFNQGELIRKDLSHVKVNIVGIAETGFGIDEVIDVKSSTTNKTLTASRNLKIKGGKIKIAGSNPTVGVYFINQATGKSTKVDPTDIVTNNPSELVVVTPALAAGKYKVQVITQFTTAATLLKAPRATIFDKILTV